jgi:hypothetical protein
LRRTDTGVINGAHAGWPGPPRELKAVGFEGAERIHRTPERLAAFLRNADIPIR